MSKVPLIKCYFFLSTNSLVTTLSEVGLEMYLHIVASLLIDLQRRLFMSQAAQQTAVTPPPINQVPLCAAVSSPPLLRTNADGFLQVNNELRVGVHVELGRRVRYITLDVNFCVRISQLFFS